MPVTYALHTDEAGNVLGTRDFSHSFQMTDWMRSLDIKPGDRVEFKALHVRKEIEEAPDTPAFIESSALATAEPILATADAGDDQPF